MNSELSLTRRDVVAFVTRAALIYNVLSALIRLLAHPILRQFSPFRPAWDGDLEYYGVGLVASFVFALAFWPFVSLIASGVVGTQSSPIVAKRDLFPLLRCVGVMLFVLSFPELAYGIYHYLNLAMVRPSGNVEERAYYLLLVTSNVICLSIGFGLAFFPAIFRALRDSLRQEESAA